MARESIVAALEADLVGPFYPPDYEGSTEEVLWLAPSRWYLTGFLAPERGREVDDPTADEDDATLLDDPEEQQGPEPEPKQKHRFPASMGMSVLLPPGKPSDEITVRVTFAEYVPELAEIEEGKRRRTAWRRSPQAPEPLTIALNDPKLATGIAIAPLIHIVGKMEPADAPGLAAGTRALSIFVVNRREPLDKKSDEHFIFQVRMELEHEAGFVPRHNRRGENATHFDERLADVQFREHYEYAVGHGVSVEHAAGTQVTKLATTWVPRYEVPKVKTGEEPSVTTEMEKLAQLEAATVHAALDPLADAYEAWLDIQAKTKMDSARRTEAVSMIDARARNALKRIRSGIAKLASDAEVLEAFKLANQAMATSALKRSPKRYETSRPAWRLFQLAFVLLNIDGIADDRHDDREQVELIFFPTGGGKTEAYLGVIAFTLLLRRMRGQKRPDKGLGVAVLLRYTLRLLTLDQLGRAATLVCALETLRVGREKQLGKERLTVGLWVGRSATANTLGYLKKQVLEYKNSPSASAVSPFPLTNCPWCNAALGKQSLKLVPNTAKPSRIVVSCTDFKCDFAVGKNPEGLPVLFVDDQIYQELPAFVVATVDKFAMLPWRGETGMLFGRVSSRDDQRFYGPVDPKPKNATLLSNGLRPPELIVQDELHLISGPLGTMVGLYETAIEYLSTLGGEKSIRPKIIASTATVRRAEEQIRALFGRTDTNVFPPSGVDDSETWFSTRDTEAPGRLYLGVAAQGRSMKSILLRTYVTLLGAGQRAYADDADAGDPYMTLAGYFNSLRELGGMRRLVEDEVHSRTYKVEDKKPLGHQGPHPWWANRTVQIEPVELTSRESTGKIKAAKERLSQPHAAPDHVDVLLASNMISVGVDIDRLGLMVVAGQPKTTAEYIQASSRVGRQKPGLVVTCFNVAKPRDRSHYERFAAYHQSFYRYVEATSLTPFSGPAVDRGLAGTLVAMSRFTDRQLTPAEGARHVAAHRAKLEDTVIAEIVRRAKTHRKQMSPDEAKTLEDELRQRSKKLLDLWAKWVGIQGSPRAYSRFDRDRNQGRGILALVTDENKGDDVFDAPTSMRDVEESVHLWLERFQLGSRSFSKGGG